MEREWSVPRITYILDFEAKTLNQLKSIVGPPHGSGFRFDPGHPQDNDDLQNRWGKTREKWFEGMYAHPAFLPCSLPPGTLFVVYQFTDRVNMAGGAIYVFHSDDGKLLGWAASNYLFSGGGFKYSYLTKRAKQH